MGNSFWCCRRLPFYDFGKVIWCGKVRENIIFQSFLDLGLHGSKNKNNYDINIKGLLKFCTVFILCYDFEVYYFYIKISLIIVGF